MMNLAVFYSQHVHNHAKAFELAEKALQVQQEVGAPHTDLT